MKSLCLQKNQIEYEGKLLKYGNNEIREGVLSVGFGIINITYSSYVFSDFDSFVLSKAVNSQVFEEMSSLWKFKDAGELGSEVTYSISFQYRKKIYENLTSLILESLGATMVDKFMIRLENEMKENNHISDCKYTNFFNDLAVRHVISQKEKAKLVSRLKADERIKYLADYYIQNSINESKSYSSIMAEDLTKYL